MLHHAWLQTWPTIIYATKPHGAVAVLTDWLLLGHFGVTIFITLSGFCLMLPVVRARGVLPGGTEQFFRRRARRILPPYYAALALSLVIACLFLRVHTHTLYDASLPVTARGTLAHILLIHNLTTSSAQINGPLWSVAVECQIYLFFPLLVWVTRRFSILLALISSCVVSLPLYHLLRDSDIFGHTPYYYLFVFTMGMFAAQIGFRSSPAVQKESWSVVAVLSTILCGFMAATVHHFIPDAPAADYAVAGAILTALFFCRHRTAAKGFAVLGWISFLFWVGIVSVYRLQHLAIADLSMGMAMTCWLVLVSRNQTGFLHTILAYDPLEPLARPAWRLFIQSLSCSLSYPATVLAISGGAFSAAGWDYRFFHRSRSRYVANIAFSLWLLLAFRAAVHRQP